MHHELVPNDEVIQRMAYARPGDVAGLPESLHGIFWIDQFLQSSIGQTPAFHGADERFPIPWMTPSTETLAAWGDFPTKWVSGKEQPKLSRGRPNPIGTAMNVPNGAGWLGHWTFGDYPADTPVIPCFSCIKPLMKCCCFPDTFIAYTSVKVTWGIRMISDFRFNTRDAIKDPELNPEGLEMILDMFAGEEYIDTAPLFEMRMQKRPFGWVRTTHVLEGAWGQMTDRQKAGLNNVLPSVLYRALKDDGVVGASQYPVIQIVDGQGNKVQPYYDEYLAWANAANPGGQYMGTFQPGTKPKCCESCVGCIMDPFLNCCLNIASNDCTACPCCNCSKCCPACVTGDYNNPLPMSAPQTMERH